MRVNLISNHHPGTELAQDVDIMRGILTAVFENNVDIQCVQYVRPHCSEADVNVFFEIINPSLFSYAAKNIWIPNHEMTTKNWVPYMHMVNEIWVKTREAEEIFAALTPTKVRYIGWTSLNKQTPSKKNYHKAIVPLGRNFHREVEPIFQAYLNIRRKDMNLFHKLPSLHIVYNPQRFEVKVPEILSHSVDLIANPTQDEYDNLLAECGLCICLSKAEGFGHAVNEAAASGCNMILSSIPPYFERIGSHPLGVQYCATSETKENEECFGTLISSDVGHLTEILENYAELSFKERKAGSETTRRLYEQNHKTWMEGIMELIRQVFVVDSPYSLKDVLPKEEDLPDVSIVCVTRDRRVFMPILKYCYMIQSYPEEKLELVIVDDGDDPIEDTLFGVPNVTYVRVDEKKTIGEKRNIGVEKAMYDVIAFMDDDDIYPNNSVLERVAMMLKSPGKECSFCTMLPCYDIVKYFSFMNMPPIYLPMSQRVSEATLTFTRKFWQERPFGATQIAEADAFIRGREHMCRELSPQEVIVSLTHPRNTCSRRPLEYVEPNGCHFGFNEKLFAMVSEIGESLKNA